MVYFEFVLKAAENFYEVAENSTKVNVSAAMTLVPTHTDINNKIESIYVSTLYDCREMATVIMA